MKNIKDYLHLYMGCQVMYDDDQGKLTYYLMYNILATNEWHLVKPILRPLSDMTEEEMKIVTVSGLMSDLKYIINRNKWTPERFLYLLSKGFDLFGLIEEGLAIDATTLKENA